MCKNIFLGTDSVLDEISFDKNMPDFHLEKIAGEFLQVSRNFSKKNIYYVGTSRGCGCDFSLIHNQISFNNEQHENFFQFGLRQFRTYLGTQESWKQRKAKRNQVLLDSNLFYLKQTHKLIDLIEDEVNKGREVELYCCWSGNYDSLAEERKTISTETIRTSFEIEEDIFVIYK